MNKQYIVLSALLLCTCIIGCKAPEQEYQPTETSEPVSFESAVVSYLGPEGTYTQEACGRFFRKQGTYIPYETVADAVDALVSGESDYAVIPQENTIGGPVIDYVDILIAETSVSVSGEVELPISQNLLVLPGTSLSDIKTVYSHKQGILQGKDWLEEHLPEAEVIEVSSTAEGAKMVSEGNDPSLAAIASAACADVYQLEILAEGIQNSDSNKTRFYVLSKGEPSVSSSDRLAFVADGASEDLPKLMKDMEEMNMKLVTIHARPLKTELGQYHYLIECAESTYKNYIKLTEKSPFSFRYLGSFYVR